MYFLENIKIILKNNNKFDVHLIMYLDWKDDRFYYKDLIDEIGLHNLNKTEDGGSEVVKKDENVVFVEQPYISKIWTPNIYIFNAIEYKKHQLNKPVESLRIYDDGTIKMSKLKSFG